jgi:methyl-accepting chemotaxis protein
MISPVIAIVIGLSIAVWIALSMKKLLASAVKYTTLIAEGDLTQTLEVHRHDEIGQLLLAIQNMVEKLKHVLANVQMAAEVVVSGSQTISSSAEEISQGASEQAAATEEASASMEQMVANIRQNADNAVQTEKIALQAAEGAEEGGFAVAEAITAMQTIAQKIFVVEDIARQTRMLSLNATIEAARAQDQGKGFAVVATEVRALAERSQKAALEITELASTGVTIAENAGTLLTSIVPNIRKTAQFVQLISKASHEQSSGAGQINRAIQQLDQVTQQNSVASEEMASMAEKLANQAADLQHAISFFQTEAQNLAEVDMAVSDTPDSL